MREKLNAEKSIAAAVESLHDAVDGLRTRSLDFFAENPPVAGNRNEHTALQHSFNTVLTALSGDIQLSKRLIYSNKPKTLKKLHSAKEHADALLVETDNKWKNYRRASKGLEGFDRQAEQFAGMLADVLALRQRLASVCESLEGLAPQGPQQGQ